MRILAVVTRGYYGRTDAVEPLYLAFTDPLIELRHEVDHFDHYLSNRQVGAERTGELFVEKVRVGNYDAVLYQTACQEARFINERGRYASRYAATIAFNSDDDFAWEKQTSLMAPSFTYMYTTYPHIYEQNRAAFPNLRLTQWACYPNFADFDRPKDLDFTFAGQIYGDRAQSCRYLVQKAGLRVYGFMSGMVHTPSFLYWPGIRKLTFRFPSIYGRPLHYREINDVWNRSKVSYTPMEASVGGDILQIKSRVFEMGLSGTLMVCRPSPNLDRYYEPGREFVPFDDLDDCIEKTKYYLAHETERARIARAYRDRTLAEHLWTHRYRAMFEEMGLN
jgi:hypothetical protein